ncbi:hypothetical protein [Roseococcus thiosulfatophilus]|uniref:hypothetical protein n=1 Tax=Roseococcus thiosulfatophilus TaxID=35813 RepID=UPI001A8F411D|nr:hypothetical protein [Roseococcus thiosulfatophilus]
MPTTPAWLAPLLVLGLAAVHARGRWPLRNPWRSAAAGASVAYIFLHLMPQLAAAEAARGVASEVVFFALALAGLVTFYGLEHALRRHDEGRAHSSIFHLHVAAFALYSLTIGYLMMQREEEGVLSLLLYAGAMALHFLASDSSLRVGHRAAQAARARYVLAGAVLLGGALGAGLRAPPLLVDALFALVAGGIVLNVLKEELPDEAGSHFGGFALGAALYGTLLLALE